MTTAFIQSIKQSADKIIDMSVVLKDRMESWANVFECYPNSQNVNISAGFVTNSTKQNTMELLVDVQAPPDDASALIRIQAIEIVKGMADDERYNQVSLHFAVEYGQARQLVEKGPSVTRNDITELLRAQSSHLVRLIVSDETGRDSVTGQLLGKRHELDPNELANLPQDKELELIQIIHTVITKLKKTAQKEATAL